MELRFWNDPETGLPHIYNHGVTMKKTVKKQRLPKGWTEEKIRKLAEHHDNMTEDEQVAEIENSLNDDNQTMMMVPTDLVPAIMKLINKKRPA